MLGVSFQQPCPNCGNPNTEHPMCTDDKWCSAVEIFRVADRHGTIRLIDGHGRLVTDPGDRVVGKMSLFSEFGWFGLGLLQLAGLAPPDTAMQSTEREKAPV
jgi:hypothetical protein